MNQMQLKNSLTGGQAMKTIIRNGKKLGSVEKNDDGMFIIKTVKGRQAGHLEYNSMESALEYVDSMMEFLAHIESRDAKAHA